MKKLSTLVLLIAVATVFNACKKSGGSSGGTTPPVATPKYTKKVLVEDVTGTWCGWCPLMAYALEQKAISTPNLVSVGLHDKAGTSDIYHSPYSTSIRSNFGINAFPTALVNRKSQADDSNVGSFIDANLGGKTTAGLKIESTLAANNISVKVSVGFSDNYSTSSMKLVCFLVEDQLVSPQANYLSGNGSFAGHPYYSKPNPIPNFVHHNVLREVGNGAPLGEPIPASQTGIDAIYTNTYTINTTGYVAANLYVVAFVLKGTECVNVQIAPVGVTKAFD